MKVNLAPEVKEVIDAVHYRPSVSIVLPFSPRIALRSELKKDIKFAIDKATRQLKDQYPEALVSPVIEKLHTLTEELIIPAGKYGLVIYASPVFSKLYFLDSLPPSRIVVDESFEIRDLLFSKKQLQPFLVFLLSGERCRLLFSDGHALIPVKMNAPDSIDAYWNDETERVSNFSDPVEYKSRQIEKFMRQMDKELIQQVQENRYPVFLMGSRTILGIYRGVSHADAFIKGSVEGNFEKSGISEIQSALSKPVQNWKREETNALLKQIEEAGNQHKLASGIEAVWKDAFDKKGKLLIVEKGYRAAGEHISGGKIVYKPTGSQNDFHISNDVVDDVMELVLKNGGDVAFVEDCLLSANGHIVLINYFS